MGASDRCYELLDRLTTLLRTEERGLAGAKDLQPAQLAVLAYLSRCNRYSNTPGAVTEYLGVTKGTASQTLRRLIDRELIAEDADADDARKTRLRLTPRGRNIVRGSLPPAVFAQALSAVSDTDGLQASLAELLRGLQRANDMRTFGVCRTCRHLLHSRRSFRCGLTGEALREEETTRICREHEVVP